jgi:hypothetical protein
VPALATKATTTKPLGDPCANARRDGSFRSPKPSTDNTVKSGGLFTLRGIVQIAGPFLVASVAVGTLNSPSLSSFVLVLSIASLGSLANPAISSILYRFRELPEPSSAMLSSFVVVLVCFGSMLTGIAAAILVGLQYAIPALLLSFFSGATTAVSADLGRMDLNYLVAKRTSLQSLVTTGSGCAVLLLGRRLDIYLLTICVVSGVFCFWLVLESHRLNPIQLTRRLMLADMRSVFSHVAVILAWIPLVFATSGADVFFVKAFDRERVAGYGIGVRVIAAAGLPLTVAAAMIPAALVRRDLLLSPRMQFRLYSRIAGLAGTLTIAVGAFVAPYLMEWLPIESSSVPSSRVLAYVGLAVAIRGTWSAANLMMLQRGNHVRTLWPGSFETLVSLVVTVFAGRRWGEVGVAVGTLAGATASFAGYLAICSRNDALATDSWRCLLSDLAPNIVGIAIFGFAVWVSPMMAVPLLLVFCAFFIRTSILQVRAAVSEDGLLP